MVPSWIDLRFLDSAEKRTFSRGQLIHPEGGEPECAMVLLSGKVKISKSGNSQRAQIIRFLGEGDLFAYRAIIAGDTYNAEAFAVSACSVLCIPRADFLHLLHTDIDFCYRVLTQLSIDLNTSEQQTINLTQKHIRGRLAESLLHLLDQYGFDEDHSTLAIYLSREELANMSNMITANAIRTLSDFTKEGLVAVDGRKIRILDEPALRHISLKG